MKKSTLRRLLLLCLCLTLVTVSLIGGTLAKYANTVFGTDTATVAKFAFNVKDGEDAAYTETNAASVNLFGTNKKIAPGETGSFTIKLDTTGSEVDVAFTADVTLPNAVTGLSIAYAVGDTKPTGTTSTAYTLDSDEELETALNTAMGTVTANTTTAKTVTVYWCWLDDGTANADQTTLGKAGTQTYPVTIAITGTQASVTAN